MNRRASPNLLHPQPRLYMGLFLPWLPAENALRKGRAPPDVPFALVEQQRGATRIAAMAQSAAQLGLEPGLTLAEARTRVPELVAVPFDPQADGALLGEVAKLCGRYTPSAEDRPPAELALDITGCAHFFGGKGGLQADLAARVKALGLTLRSAFAATPDAACALARFGVTEIADLPLAALGMEREVLVGLRRAGLRRIGELAALPRAPLAARFGRELVQRLARLTEEEDPHVTARQAVETIREEARFAEPVVRTDDVLDVIAMLVGAAAERLRERDEGARALAVRLHRGDGQLAQLTIECGSPTRDPQVLMRLLRERIESLADPLDPGFGYDFIDIAVPHAEHLVERQDGLEQECAPRPAIGPLIDRLAVRHGAGAIRGFAAGDSYLPERAGRLVAFGSGQESPWPEGMAGDPPLRPLLLFDPPQRVQVLAAVPDGPPRLFRWRGRAYRVAREEGPERIAPEWWRRRGGHAENAGLSRDYYRVEDEEGHRFWLFRHGLYERESSDPAWYLHGLFA